MNSIFKFKIKNIFKTYALFAGFLIVVIGLGFLFAQVYQNSSILIFAAVFSVLMAVGSYWFSDKLVLKMTKAEPLREESHPEIYEMIRRLTKEANLPMPKLYLIHEDQPNAFATGRNPKHAVVAVTTGILKRLNRDELEGVLAHELSHIGNRDMLVSTVAVVLVGFISILGDMFLRSLFFRSLFGLGGRRDDRGGGGALILIGIVLSILAPLGAMLMRAAISRRRETLADFSGANLTKQPEHLATALEKISQAHIPMKVANNTTSHLWIENPFRGRERISLVHKLFMSHPPVEERVKALRGLKF